MWSRQIGEAAKLAYLFILMNTSYIYRGLQNLPKILPTFRDPDTYLYAREYHGKIMLGIFEPNAKNALKKLKSQIIFAYEFKVERKYVKMLHQLAAKRMPLLKDLKIEK